MASTIASAVASAEASAEAVASAVESAVASRFKDPALTLNLLYYTLDRVDYNICDEQLGLKTSFCFPHTDPPNKKTEVDSLVMVAKNLALNFDLEDFFLVRKSTHIYKMSIST